MKRRILCFVLTMAMVLSMLVVIPAASVTADSYDLSISTTAQFKAFRDAVNAGTYDSGVTVQLTADIDISDADWTPIGSSTGHPFKGTFNGNGHTISGLYQTRSSAMSSGNAGLFGYVSSVDGGSTTITNFKLTSSGNGIKGSNGGADVGTVVSQVRGSTTGIVTVYVTGIWSTVNFDCGGALMQGVGGIVGDMGWVTNALETKLYIDSCRYSGTLDSPSAGTKDYGGILGWTRENNTPKSFYITNCIFDGVISIYASSPDDNGGIAGYLKGNTNSSKVIFHVENCIVAGQFLHRNISSQTNTGYIVSEQSGSNVDYKFTNVYYCTDSDRHTGGAMGGWYGYMKGGSTVPSSFTVSNVTAKTMTELKALTTGFADDTKWHFYNNGSDLPIPAMIYANIIAAAPPSIFDDLSQSTFTITTADELMQFASIVNAGTSQFQGKTVYLGANIDLTGYTWQSIGKTRGGGSTTFRGTFDGQGHTISNMTSSTNNADGEGGLFGYVVYSATIRNFHLTGTITATGNSASGSGYFGSVIGCAFQTTATINLSNIWSSVNINCSNSGGKGIAIGGLVGQIRSASNMGTLTMNIDSCVYDGSISDGNRYDCIGGFIGRTHENISGRPLNLTITNSVFAGTIHVNDIYSEDISCLIGYIKGNKADAAVNVTITNVISTGRVFFYTGDSREWNPVSKCLGGILSSEITGTVPVVTVTNLYYKNFQVPVGAANAATWQDTALYFNTPECTVTVTGGGKKTTNEMLALTTSSFTNSSKWNKTDDYYPCPKSIVDTFGLPTSLYVEPTEIYIGTAEALNALATAVNNGTTYEGKTIHITADITIGSGWNSIGITSSKPFLGNFNGHGHTIEIHQTLTNPDGIGGLIGFVRTPAGGTSTIENVHVTGRIDATNNNSGSGYFGGLIACVDGNTSGSGGTININNVWNSVYINCGNANAWWGVGGMIGFVRHADGLKPLTVNFDSCIWDGTLNVGPAAYYFGGYVGYTGNNKAGRTLTINITNSVASGKVALNIDWNQTVGLLIGYAKGANSDADTAKVTVNVSDVISNGTMTFKTGTPGSGSSIGHIGSIDGTTELNMTNLYYKAFKRGVMTGNAPALGSGTATSETNVESMSGSQIYGLTAADFTTAAKWNLTSGYNPCPAGIVSTFGSVPDSFAYEATVTYIGTIGEFIAFRDDVNSGTNFAGEIIRLTADIDLTGIEWQEIGLYNTAPFSGVFDGNGHTISNMTSAVSADATGALFGYVSNATIKNLTLTGRITTSGARNFIASVVNCVSGDTTLQNVESSVYITQATNGNAMNYTGGLVGFIHNSNNTNLTINGCTFSGTINTGGQTRSVAGILGYTGWGNSGVTKTVTITNTQFTGAINLNDISYYCQNAGFIGYVKCVGGTITVNISNSYSDGKIYFNRAYAWTRSNNGECGQIIGGVDSGVTLNIANTVSYRPAYLYTSVSSGTPVASSKVVLGELGSFGSNYSVDTAALVEGMEIYAEKCTVTVSGNSKNAIRFVATIASASCSGAETQDATFGVYIMTKAMYDLYRGALTTTNLDAANTTMITKVKALKCKDTSDGYVVNAIVYGFDTTAEKSGELVAIPYAGSRLGEAIVTTYNSL